MIVSTCAWVARPIDATLNVETPSTRSRQALAVGPHRRRRSDDKLLCWDGVVCLSRTELDVISLGEHRHEQVGLLRFEQRNKQGEKMNKPCTSFGRRIVNQSLGRRRGVVPRRWNLRPVRFAAPRIFFEAV